MENERSVIRAPSRHQGPPTSIRAPIPQSPPDHPDPAPQQDDSPRRSLFSRKRRAIRSPLIANDSNVETFKYICLYMLTGCAITSSIFVIQSCEFFSYQDLSQTLITSRIGDNFDNNNNNNNNLIINSNSNSNNDIKSKDNGNSNRLGGSRKDNIFARMGNGTTDTPDHDEDYEIDDLLLKDLFDNKRMLDQEDFKYSPFASISEGTVGLFSFSLGDTTFGGSRESILPEGLEDVCFRYYDEVTDYQLLRSNTHGNGADKWVAARYCAILAPMVALLAIVQMVWECFGECPLPYCSMVLNLLCFVLAGSFQLGTFALFFAPRTLSSTDPQDYESRFCISHSTIRCTMGSGSWLSLVAAVFYLVAALLDAKLRQTNYGIPEDPESEDEEHRLNLKQYGYGRKPRDDLEANSTTRRRSQEDVSRNSSMSSISNVSSGIVSSITHSKTIQLEDDIRLGVSGDSGAVEASYAPEQLSRSTAKESSRPRTSKYRITKEKVVPPRKSDDTFTFGPNTILTRKGPSRSKGTMRTKFTKTDRKMHTRIALDGSLKEGWTEIPLNDTIAKTRRR